MRPESRPEVDAALLELCHRISEQPYYERLWPVAIPWRTIAVLIAIALLAGI